VAGFVRDHTRWIAQRLDTGREEADALMPPKSSKSDAQRATQQLQLLRSAVDRYLAELGEPH
jgi:hypothetical protein